MTRTYDLSRCKEAYDLWRRGIKQTDIARQMQLSNTRISIMIQVWRDHLLEIEAQTDLIAYRNGG